MSSRKAWALGLAALCSAASLAATPSAMAGETAAAATCTHPKWSDKDSNTGTIKGYTNSPLRTGPNAGCPTAGWPSVDETLYYDCYVRNSAGNTWTHMQTKYGETGWMPDVNLDDHGSSQLC